MEAAVSLAAAIKDEEPPRVSQSQVKDIYDELSGSDSDG